MYKRFETTDRGRGVVKVTDRKDKDRIRTKGRKTMNEQGGDVDTLGPT